MAQRGGGHGGGGSHASMGGGSRASVSSGVHGGSYGAVRAGGVGSGYRGGYGYGGRGYGYGGYGHRGSYWPYYGWGYPWYGVGFSYWPNYSYGYYNYYPNDYYDSGTYSDPGYATVPGPSATYSPAQNDSYRQTGASGSYDGPVYSVTRSYDEYGQETNAAAGGSASSASPIYLFALRDGSIQGAGSYWIVGQALHYVTLDRQEKQVGLDSIDRSLTMQLNRERRVSMNLPPE